MSRSPHIDHRRGAAGAARHRATRTGRWLIFFSALSLGGCGWLGLGWGAITYPTTDDGESANVVASGGYAYATRGADGVEVIELAAPAARSVMAPAAGTSADDIAIADELLFVLDARPPGHLAVYSLADPARPALVQLPVPVDVGPFSGVAAAGGLVVVSGGTSLLSLRRYAPDGRLDSALATADLGRGQPDVLLGADGRQAFVSVHDNGPRFSLRVLQLSSDPLEARPIASLPLDTYGFTPGGARPASFPVETASVGNLLLVASAAGLQVIDVTDPATLRPLATLQVGALPVNVDVRAGIAAVVGSVSAPELALVDLSNPSAPARIRSIRLPQGTRATGVALADRHVIVAAHALGTLVFRLDNLTLTP